MDRMSEADFGRVRHFIWDFDGTLFDTYPVIIRNLRDALALYGQDANPVEAMGLMLQNIPTARNFYADRFGIPRQELQDAYDRFHAQANREMEAQPMEDVLAVLRRIREKGCHSYIFTHRKMEETRSYLEKYGLLEEFQDIIAPESPCFAPKPQPDAVLYLMEQYSMEPEDTVMIGDRECDLGSARNAGIRTAHLVCPAVPENLNCDWRLENFQTMLRLLG